MAIRTAFWLLFCCCFFFLLPCTGLSDYYMPRFYDPLYVVSSTANSSVAAASSWSPSVPSIFSTARIFTGPATVSINTTYCTDKRIFVRLYFYPSAYDGRNASAAVFDVQAGDCMLLRNFTPAWDVEALNIEYVIREYSLDSPESGIFNLTFVPSTKYQGSYAFFNLIEIMCMPDIFTSLSPLPVLGSGTTFDLSPRTALETMHRLNVGGNNLTYWIKDDSYIFQESSGVVRTIDPNVIKLKYLPATPKYVAEDALHASDQYNTAPDEVYTSQRFITGSVESDPDSKLAWMFAVDPGFHYMVRLHFCYLEKLTDPNVRLFSILINDVTATDRANINAWATLLVGNSTSGAALAVPFYKDYVTYLPNDPEKVSLRIDLHPNDLNPKFIDAAVNGIEVFKLNSVPGFNNATGYSLAPSRPAPLRSVTVDPDKVLARKTNRGASHRSRAGGIVLGVAGGVMVTLGFAVLGLVLRRKKRRRATPNARFQRPDRQQMPPLPHKGSTNTCRRFTFTEIEDATQGFADGLVIGVGGFGKVYRGVIRPVKSMASAPAGIKVAVKRAHPTSEQGIREFLNEVEMLSMLRHRHLVSLLGFCDEQGEMILVYEYMANGTLREHLCNKYGSPTLRWRQRLEICIDAARGLHYLHTGAKQTIIHRDVKTTNILLDETWVAKVADFGLCKVGSAMERRNVVVSTAVKGSFGYLDPEYYRRQKLTDKSDVYSFGVVLFEVLCSRPAVNVDLPHEQVSLAEWARYCYENGVIDTIVDQNLKTEIAPDCFVKFSAIAHKCISDCGLDRPSMGDVLWSLESALQLQENFEMELDSSATNASSSNCIDWPTTDSAAFTSNAAIFSEIVDPRGR